MLSLEHRPATFRQLAGQDLVKKALLHIIKDPINSPKTLLLCGPFGSGKTTAARIFARALNCDHKLSNGDACGECDFCKSDIQNSLFYSEYDSAVVGNVNSIRELRDTFYFGYNKGYKVIVLDEVHLVSKQAQGALLKILEEPEPNVFYLLCTTDPEKLLPTIVSRSFELRYDLVPVDDIIPFLKSVLLEKEIEVTPDIEVNIKLIAERCGGHMRNAIMLLDSMLLLKEDFRETVETSKPLFYQLFNLGINYKSFVAKNPRDAVNKKAIGLIDKLNSFSIKHLRQDYESLVLVISRAVFFDDEDASILTMIKNHRHGYDLISIFNDPVVYLSFNNSTTFQIGMITLFNRLKDISR